MTQRIGGEVFFLLWYSPNFGRKIPQRKGEDIFLKFGFHPKKLGNMHTAPIKLKVENLTL